MNLAPTPARCRICRLGQVEYGAAWKLQQHLVSERAADRMDDTLLLLEHPPTFTLGRRTAAAHLLVSAEAIRERGAAIFQVDRGGDITFHGPGQLVCYPIISLANRQGGASRYLRDLEETLIRALAGLGVEAKRVAGLTGVWVGDRKIAAIGARINAKRVTSHGFALNVSTDLAYFDWIVPCGIRGRGVTSLQRVLKREVPVDEVAACVTRAFGAVFDLAMEATSPELLFRGIDA
jgi:lipoyl(octanoyl) transferase